MQAQPHVHQEHRIPPLLIVGLVVLVLAVGALSYYAGRFGRPDDDRPARDESAFEMPTPAPPAPAAAAAVIPTPAEAAKSSRQASGGTSLALCTNPDRCAGVMR